MAPRKPLARLMRWALLFAWPALLWSQPRMVRNPAPVVYFMPDVARSLAEKYRTTQVDSLSLEFGACLSYEAQALSEEARLYRVTKARFAPQTADLVRGPDGRIAMYRLFMWCRPDELHLHSHSRHQCTGILGQECIDAPILWMRPSLLDIQSVRGHPLGIIQYADSLFLPYFPDSLPYWPDSILPKPNTDALRRDLYLTALSLGVLSNALWKYDDDPGGYAPRLDAWTAAHFSAGMALENVGSSMRVPTWWRIGGTCAAGVGWELSQRFRDWRDASATCAGALVSWGLRELWR